MNEYKITFSQPVWSNSFEFQISTEEIDSVVAGIPQADEPILALFGGPDREEIATAIAGKRLFGDGFSGIDGKRCIVMQVLQSRDFATKYKAEGWLGAVEKL